MAAQGNGGRGRDVPAHVITFRRLFELFPSFFVSERAARNWYHRSFLPFRQLFERL